ncbi:hypothetical protein BV25DRAFT_1372488 [Artomyces pyxidatus]|uniref:Uncharacterized protein n=1 Tax=Artomyces pyxidatus TaxID=48021 RepID=A0ACB8SNT8_9AGAM|nr:hypothetical protein BV25DRAFT_1372488 [Artomyces pyxidatus]
MSCRYNSFEDCLAAYAILKPLPVLCHSYGPDQYLLEDFMRCDEADPLVAGLSTSSREPRLRVCAVLPLHWAANSYLHSHRRCGAFSTHELAEILDGTHSDERSRDADDSASAAASHGRHRRPTKHAATVLPRRTDRIRDQSLCRPSMHRQFLAKSCFLWCIALPSRPLKQRRHGVLTTRCS